MHGTGNDYIFINCMQQTIVNPSQTAVMLSDRHFGVGGDGLVLILESDKADARMKIYNNDGSEGRICGNAIRCVGKYLYDQDIIKNTNLSIETSSGIRQLQLIVSNGMVSEATVDMGEPIFSPNDIPMFSAGDNFINRPIAIWGRTMYATALSMGNPHWVFRVKDVDSINLEATGPLFEHHKLFPDRVNTEFVAVESNGIHMRVWERGSGETLSCGSGACAAAVACSLNGWCPRSVDVFLRGGTLHVDWAERNNHVFLTGNAQYVYTGEIFIPI